MLKYLNLLIFIRKHFIPSEQFKICPLSSLKWDLCDFFYIYCLKLYVFFHFTLEICETSSYPTDKTSFNLDTVVAETLGLNGQEESVSSDLV